MRTIILDNEAVQALIDPSHRKHRVVMAHLAAVGVRRRRGDDVSAVVPTAVRVEAAWDRTDPRRADVNRMRITDKALDGAAADRAAEIVARTGVGVADAHVGAVVAVVDGEVVVLTSDPDDMVAVSSPRTINAVRI
jgi:hypothetical protein